MTMQTDAASFPPDGGGGTLRVSTARECAWSARSETGWVVLTSDASGQGDGLVQFRVSSNDAPAPRNGAIAVNEQRQPISQQGRPCEFSLSSDHESMPGAGGERTIDVTASSAQCGWTAAAEAPWVTIVEGRQGSGNGAVTFTVAPATGPPRSATLTIAGQSVRIDQGNGCTFSVNPASLSVASAGGEQVVRVDATGAQCTWTATAGAPWITIAGSNNGTGSGAVTVRVAPTDGPPRSATLTIAGRTVRIDQGTGCAVNLNPASSTIAAQGGSLAIGVESGAGCPWTAAAGQSWVSIASGAQGSGPGRVDVAVSANSGPARSGDVTIGGRVFAISQASGCAYTIAPTSQNVPGASTTGVVSVATAAGCPWTVESSVSWITLASGTGTGPGDLRFTTAPNESPARTGTITIAGHAFTVNQESLCTYTLAPPSHEFDASGGNGNVLVIVNGPCTWTAASAADWIQMTAGLSGRGDGLVQFTVPPNAGPPRTGFVTIAGQQYRVTQAAR